MVLKFLQEKRILCQLLRVLIVYALRIRIAQFPFHPLTQMVGEPECFEKLENLDEQIASKKFTNLSSIGKIFLILRKKDNFINSLKNMYVIQDFYGCREVLDFAHNLMNYKKRLIGKSILGIHQNTKKFTFI